MTNNVQRKDLRAHLNGLKNLFARYSELDPPHIIYISPSYTKLFRTHTLYQGGGLPYYLINPLLYKRQIL